MTGLPPVPTEFDPAADGLPEVLDPSRLPQQGAGRVVTLLSSAGSDQDAWSRDCAVAVAQAWAERGVRVFLADLGLERPTLHETLDVPNEEGLSDLFRFGASVQRVAHRVGELPFFFTSAGSPVFGSEDVLRSERWSVLIDGFAEAGAALVLYLPAGEAGADAVLSRTTDLIVLGGDVPQGLLEGTTLRPLAWVARPGAGQAGGAGVEVGAGTITTDPAPSDVPDPADGLEAWTGTDGDVREDALDGVQVEADPDAGWGDVLESADTQSFDVPDLDAHEPAGAEPFWDPSPEGWDDVAPGLEIDPDLGGSFEDVGTGPADAAEAWAEGPVEGADIESRPEAGDAASVNPAEAEWSPSEPTSDASSRWSGTPDEVVGDVPAPAPRQGRVAETQPPATPEKRRGGRRWVAWGGAAAIVILGAWQLTGSGFLSGDGAGGAGGEPPPDGETVTQDPGVTSDPTDTEAPATPAADVDPGDPTSPLLDASLVIQSFPNASEAQEFADRLSENLGDLLFTVIPSLINGQTWYRTVAGPARDVSEIPGIQERIERANLSMLAGRSGWFPRRTGLAFLLTEEPVLSDADALAARYRGEGIPAYVLAIDYSAGVRRYRVYAGGYAFEDESAPLGRILTDAGVDAELVPRLGSMPSGR